MELSPATLLSLVDYAELESRTYSGREMYGRRCMAVTIEPGEQFQTGLRLARAAVALTADEDEAALLIDALSEMETRTDALGRNVVLYWPQMPPGAGDDNRDQEVGRS